MSAIVDHQIDWYKRQSVEYRRGWWEWVADKPYYREMYRRVLKIEKDESVIREMNRVDEELRSGR